MNKFKKKITVRFFSIEATDSFYDDFASRINSNNANEQSVRIINIRDKKHLIKTQEKFQYQEKEVFSISIVRERNSWQTRALGDGTISGIPLNQGIIGDPYYLWIIPKDRVVLGFTTGSSTSLKSVAGTVLRQFNKDRNEKITLEPLSKGDEFSRLRELAEYNKLKFKIDPSSLEDLSEGAPDFFKNLSALPLLPPELGFTYTDIGEGKMSVEELLDFVNYLSENDSCRELKVYGRDSEDRPVHLDFSKTHFIYAESIEIRNKFVDENNAKGVLLKAIASYVKFMLTK
jgi:hypothetical protein